MTKTLKDIELELNRLTVRLAEFQAGMDQIDDGHELFQMLAEQTRLQTELNQCHILYAQHVSEEIDVFKQARSRF
jgi:hypothetical protein